MKINNILKEALKRINPSREELSNIDKFLKNFTDEFRKALKKARIDAEIFVGGSYAKRTMIKKGQYDIDIFVRFEERYRKENLSILAEKCLRSMKRKEKLIKIHGSRDYFRINSNSSFFIEIIPVLKVKNPKQAENITDLSYFHVNYIRKKIKTEKMLGEIRLAKAFCHANRCYGAESYISGFSGYALELLVYHYGGFLKFVKAMAKIQGKEIIDIEKMYKNKYEIAMNMNSAKMASPVVVIDPTYKERNALAALSRETFENFREACKAFLKNPKLESFEMKKINLDKIKKNMQKDRGEFVLLNAETDKQEGDVAGSKLIKFYRHIGEEIEKPYRIIDRGFEYGGKKEAEYFFAVKKKEEIIYAGPQLSSKENVKIFRKHHKDTFTKDKRMFAKEKIKGNIREFIEEWKLRNKKKMGEMHIKKLDIIEF